MHANFNNFMEMALKEARAAAMADEVPVGAVIIHKGQLVAKGQNRTRRDTDPSAHAEIIAIRAACDKLGQIRLDDCDLFVTLEPCAMCAGAIAETRIKRLYFGAEDPKSGGTYHGAKVFSHSQAHHQIEIYSGLMENEAQNLLREFFASKRK